MFGSQPFGGLSFGGGSNGNPSVTSVLRINANNLVAITGTDFSPNATVMFGTVWASGITVVNANKITCLVPNTTATTITVTNPDGAYATFTAPLPVLSVTTTVGGLNANGAVSTAPVVSTPDLSYGYQRINRPGFGRYMAFRLQHSGVGQKLRVEGLEVPFSIVGRRPEPTPVTTPAPTMTVTMSVGSLDNTGAVFYENPVVASANLTQDYQRLGRPGTGRYLSLRLQHSGTGQRARVYGIEIPFADIGRRDR